MPTRRVLKAVIDNFLSKVVSRNADLDGYWALGRMLRAMKASGALGTSIELVSEDDAPVPGSVFARLPAASPMLRQMFSDQIRRQRLPQEWVRSARLHLDFGPETRLETHALGEQGGEISLTAHRCRIALSCTDELGRVWSAEEEVWVWPTEPGVEQRRSLSGTAEPA